jgi:ketosteroid isomerase-like protein
MPRSPVEMVQAILADPTNPDVVDALVAPDATYVSLNYENAELKKILPWTGTHRGPQSIRSTFKMVGEYWENQAFDIEAIFGADENVAVFGRFTFRSNSLGKTATSPFSIFAKIRNGKVVYMQFMEDTFATAATFRAGGASTFRSDPKGGEVQI